MSNKWNIVGNKKAYKDTGDARNMSIDENTLNQSSLIRIQIFDKVTILVQQNQHLLPQDSTPQIAIGLSDGPPPDGFNARVNATQKCPNTKQNKHTSQSQTVRFMWMS